MALTAVGASETVTASVRDANGRLIPGSAVSWTSSDITVADVSGGGNTAVVTARAPGRTTIRATTAGFVQELTVQVLGVRTITIAPLSLALRAGDQLSFTTSLDADQGALLDLRWQAENPAVATVNSQGLVTGVGPGATVVRVTAVGDPRVTATAQVTVAPARRVSITPNATTLWVGDAGALAATIDVDSTQASTLTWSSDNAAIVSVSATGAITAVGVGTTFLRATATADARVRDSASVRVLPARVVAVSPATASLGAGEQRAFTAQVTIEAGLSTAVTWRSSHSAVATVSFSGTVTGVALGTATITAVSIADTTRRASSTVTIVPIVRDLDVSPSAVSLFTGDTRQLTANLTADPGAARGTIWRSSNPAVATVSSNGAVSALSVGSAIVTALAEADTTRRATSLITVRYAPVVTVSPTALSLSLNEQRTLTANVQAESGVSTAVTWRTNNAGVVSVTATGVITATGFGTALVTVVSVADTTRRAAATVTVAPAIRSLALSPTAVTVFQGDVRTLTATLVADPGASTAIIWRSGNSAIASVSGGGDVSALTVGTTTVTAIAAGDTTKRATATVTVAAGGIASIHVVPTAAALFAGQSVQLTPIVVAQGGLSQGVIYRSSNPAVASVNFAGVVSATGNGLAVITVAAIADTTKKATASISVAPRPITVAIAQSALSLSVGGSTTLSASVSADPGVSTQVSWSSSAVNVATVSSGGMVTALAAGSTIITAASVADNSRRDTLTVTVAPTRLATSWASSRLSGALYEDVIAIDAIDASNAFSVNTLGDVFRWNGAAWALATTGAAHGTQFLSVSAISSSNVFAVGVNGVVVRFNGSSWSPVNSGTTNTLRSVWFENTSTAFAVGENGTAVRWNGSSWSTTSTGSSRTLRGVWSSAGTAFAVGDGGEMLRFNSGVWSLQATPTTETLYGVAGTTSADVVAVGSFGTVLRYNGSSWTLANSGGSADLYAVSGSSANGGRMYIVSDMGLQQLNGTTLSPVATPYTPRMLSTSIDGSGNVWAGGQRGSVQRLSGSTWSTLSIAPDLVDVWTTSATNAWAVGEFGFVYRWNGSSWTRQTTPTTLTLNTVWGAGNTEAFAAGENGTMLRFNGSTWSAMSVPSSATIYSLWGTSGSNVYAATASGQVLRYNGSSWSVVATAGSALWTVHGSSASDIFASGENGTSLRFNGSGWSAVGSASGATLAGSWSGGVNTAFSVGAATNGTTGVAYRFIGSGWSSMSTGSSRVLTSIWGPSSTDLYATGEQGTILRYNGTAWSSMSTGTSDLLWSVSGAPDGSGGAFAVGFNSTVVTGTGGAGFAAGMIRTRSTSTQSLDPAANAPRRSGPLPTGAARALRRDDQGSARRR